MHAADKLWLWHSPCCPSSPLYVKRKRRVLKKRRVTDTTGKWNGKCECGVKARLCTVRRPCANLGRQFWGCGTWTQLQGKGRCTFLMWIDEIIA